MRFNISFKGKHLLAIALITLLFIGLAFAGANVFKLAPPDIDILPGHIVGHSSADLVVNVAGVGACSGDISLQDAIDNGCLEAAGGACVRVNSNDLDNSGDYVVNLLVNGENICAGPSGCSIRAWSRYDSDHFNAGWPRAVMHSGFFIKTSVGAGWWWAYDDERVNERRGYNGNANQQLLFGSIGGNTDCELYDDKAPFNDVDTFVLHDDDSDERCYISICKRG